MCPSNAASLMCFKCSLQIVWQFLELSMQVVDRLHHFVVVVICQRDCFSLCVYVAVQFWCDSLHHVDLASVDGHLLLQLDIQLSYLVLYQIEPRFARWLAQSGSCLAHLTVWLQLLNPLKSPRQLSVFLLRSSIKRAHSFFKWNQESVNFFSYLGLELKPVEIVLQLNIV